MSELASYINEHGSGDEGDVDKMEEDSDDGIDDDIKDRTTLAFRSKVAQADDFDFDEEDM